MKNQIQQETRLIVDGTLLHHQINDLLRYYNAFNGDIVNHFTNLIQIIQPLNPIVIYLRSGDVGKRLRYANESRGKLVPAKEEIAFWENRKQIDLFVLEKLSLKSHIIDIDNGWDLALETMIKYGTK